MSEQAEALDGQGKYAQAQPLYEKALEIRRRVITDLHPYTAFAYIDLATNLDAQEKYAQGQPLREKSAGDPPPAARRGPPRHRHKLQQRGIQPQQAGEVRPGPAAV